MLLDINNKIGAPDEAYFKVRFPFDSRREMVWKEVCSFLQNHYVPSDARVLELGAGYCSFINNIRAKNKHALDVSNIIVEYANPDVTTHVASCTAMDFLPEDAFDVVFASNLFEHLTREELAQTLHELRRVLTPGGALILLQPNFTYCAAEYFHDYTHIQIFTHESLPDLLRANGFEVSDVRAKFLPVNMKSRLALKLPKLHLITRLYLHFPIKPLAGQMLIVARNDRARLD